jgi:hypothetical protein
MKHLFNLAVIIFSFTFLSSSSCKKKTQTDCGCDAPIRTTITETQNLIGRIGYNDQAFQGYNSYKDKFIIVYTEANCSNCIHYMVVCNESVLSTEMLSLKNNSSATLNVNFAGHLRPVCDKIIGPGDETHEFITLTKIVKQ